MSQQALSVLLDHDQAGEEYKVAAFAIGAAMRRDYPAVLAQLVQDVPVWDGEMITKVAGDNLITWGLVVRICVSHETIYTAIYAHARGKQRRELIVCLRNGRSTCLARSRGADRRGQIPEVVSC